MLRIGYDKEQIIRFFSGQGASMEAESKQIPDYRNPSSKKYLEIHKLVAKKQNLRHNQLHIKHRLPPVPELPQFSSTNNSELPSFGKKN